MDNKNIFGPELTQMLRGVEGMMKKLKDPIKEAAKNMSVEDAKKMYDQFKEMGIDEKMKEAQDLIINLRNETQNAGTDN